MKGLGRLVRLSEAAKYRLALMLVWGVVLLLLVMIFEGAIFNFDCPLTDFLQFKCWRWGPAR